MTPVSVNVVTLALQNLVQSKHPFTKIICSPGLKSDTLQQTLLNRVSDLSKSSPVADMSTAKSHNKAPPTKHLFFLDDLSATETDGVTGRLNSLFASGYVVESECTIKC